MLIFLIFLHLGLRVQYFRVNEDLVLLDLDGEGEDTGAVVVLDLSRLQLDLSGVQGARDGGCGDVPVRERAAHMGADLAYRVKPFFGIEDTHVEAVHDDSPAFEVGNVVLGADLDEIAHIWPTSPANWFLVMFSLLSSHGSLVASLAFRKRSLSSSGSPDSS